MPRSWRTFEIYGASAFLLLCGQLAAQDQGDFIRRMDTNGNGMIDPEEAQGRARSMLERMAQSNPRINLSRPIPVEMVSREMERMRGGFGGGENGGRGGGSGGGTQNGGFGGGFSGGFPGSGGFFGGGQSGNEQRSGGGRNARQNGLDAAGNPVPTLLEGFGNEYNDTPVLGFGSDQEANPTGIKLTEDDTSRMERTLRQNDRNNDGVIEGEEISKGRWDDGDPKQFDSNRDGRLTKNELLVRAAKKRVADEAAEKADREQRNREREQRGGDRGGGDRGGDRGGGRFGGMFGGGGWPGGGGFGGGGFGGGGGWQGGGGWPGGGGGMGGGGPGGMRFGAPGGDPNATGGGPGGNMVVTMGPPGGGEGGRDRNGGGRGDRGNGGPGGGNIAITTGPAGGGEGGPGGGEFGGGGGFGRGRGGWGGGGGEDNGDGAARLEGFFKDLDKDQSGSLEQAEWGGLTRVSGEELDKDKNGVVSKQEYMEIVGERFNIKVDPAKYAWKPSGPITYRAKDMREKNPEVPAWFWNEDKNGDGQISMAERSTNWTDERLARWMKEDTNGDGVISMKEAVASLKPAATGLVITAPKSDAAKKDQSAVAAAPAGDPNDRGEGNRSRNNGNSQPGPRIDAEEAKEMKANRSESWSKVGSGNKDGGSAPVVSSELPADLPKDIDKAFAEKSAKYFGQKLDTDPKDGFLSGKEMEDYKDADTNKDGKVSLTEYIIFKKG